MRNIGGWLSCAFLVACGAQPLTMSEFLEGETVAGYDVAETNAADAFSGYTDDTQCRSIGANAPPAVGRVMLGQLWVYGAEALLVEQLGLYRRPEADGFRITGLTARPFTPQELAEDLRKRGLEKGAAVAVTNQGMVVYATSKPDIHLIYEAAEPRALLRVVEPAFWAQAPATWRLDGFAAALTADVQAGDAQGARHRLRLADALPDAERKAFRSGLSAALGPVIDARLEVLRAGVEQAPALERVARLREARALGWFRADLGASAGAINAWIRAVESSLPAALVAEAERYEKKALVGTAATLHLLAHEARGGKAAAAVSVAAAARDRGETGLARARWLLAQVAVQAVPAIVGTGALQASADRAFQGGGLIAGTPLAEVAGLRLDDAATWASLSAASGGPPAWKLSEAAPLAGAVEAKTEAQKAATTYVAANDEGQRKWVAQIAALEAQVASYGGTAATTGDYWERVTQKQQHKVVYLDRTGASRTRTYEVEREVDRIDFERLRQHHGARDMARKYQRDLAELRRNKPGNVVTKRHVHTRQWQVWQGQLTRSVRVEAGGEAEALEQRVDLNRYAFLKAPGGGDGAVAAVDEWATEAEVRARALGVLDEDLGRALAARGRAWIAARLAQTPAGVSWSAEEARVERALRRHYFGLDAALPGVPLPGAAPPAEVRPVPAWQPSDSHRVCGFDADGNVWTQRFDTPNHHLWKGHFSLELLDASTGEVVRSVPPAPGTALGHLEHLKCPTISPDGRHGVMRASVDLQKLDDHGTYDVNVALTLGENGFRARTVRGSLLPEHGAVWTDGGELVEPYVHTVRVYDPFTRERTAGWNMDPAGRAHDATVDASGRYALLVDGEGVAVWDVGTRKLAHRGQKLADGRYGPHGEGATGSTIAADGRRAILGVPVLGDDGLQGQLALVDLRAEREIAAWPTAGRPRIEAHLSADGRTLHLDGSTHLHRAHAVLRLPEHPVALRTLRLPSFAAACLGCEVKPEGCY